MPVGIAKIAPRDNNLQENAEIVVIPFGEKMNFTVFIYKSTKNEEATKRSIKWIWVEAVHLDALRQMSKEEKFEHWGNWSIKEKNSLPIYGIGKDYAQSANISIENISKRKDLVGKKYWIEAFIYYPEFKIPIGKYFVVKGKPAILSAHFEGTATGKDSNLIKSKYGKAVNVIINTHCLPDISMNYHNYVIFEVDIHCYEKDKKVTTTPFRSIINFNQAAKEYNAAIKVGIILEDSWRKDTDHNSDKELRHYYPVIKATHYYNKDATYNGETKTINGWENAVGAKFSSVSPNGEIVAFEITEEDWKTDNWMENKLGRDKERMRASAAKYEEKEITFNATESKGSEIPIYVQLPYTTQSEAIEARNFEAGLMMAEVKDIDFTCKRYDPCKFTAIDVKVGTQGPVTIFNENEPENIVEVTDNTCKTFDFIAGDKEKETVTITLKDLSVSDYNAGDGYKCYEAEPHSLKNIIDPTKVSPQWLVEKGSAGDKNIQTYEVNEGKITLNMGYNFNKSYDNSVLDYLAYDQDYLSKGLLGDAIKNIWVIRYLLKMIRNEGLEQPYVIPVSTCRYPNQAVRLNVYPDLKWVINFNYNINTPIYYKATDTKAEYSARFHEGLDDYGRPLLVSSNSRERQKILDAEISNALVGYVGQKSSFEIGIQCQTGNDTPFDLNKLFEKKFQSMLSPLLSIHDYIDSTFGVSDAKQIDTQIKAQKVGRFNKLAARLNKLPMSFELESPKIAMGVGIGYGNACNNNVGYEIEGQILMNPIVGANIKLDVLALGEKFKPWGAIITALDLVSFAADLLSGGDLQLNYELYIQLTAQINLVSSKSKDGEANPASLTYSLLDKKFTSGDIGLQGALQGKIVASLSLKLKVYKEQGKKFIDRHKDKKKSFETGIEIEGSSSIALTLGSSFGKGDNFDTDFYFSGVTLRIKIKFGYNKKNESEFNILPDYENKIEVLKNKGEYK